LRVSALRRIFRAMAKFRVVKFGVKAPPD
jgi:hypothetical protein